VDFALPGVRGREHGEAGPGFRDETAITGGGTALVWDVFESVFLMAATGFKYTGETGG